MQHRAVRRDPTIALVIGILVVIGLVVAITKLPDNGTAGQPLTSPTPLVTITPSSPPTNPVVPLRKQGHPVCVQDVPDSTITVVDYNIKSGHGGGTLAEIAAAIRAADADVVLLQEVDVDRGSSGDVDMPTYFGDALGMHHAFGANVYHGGPAQYGTAVLSKFPIVSVENTHLPRPGNTQQRGLLHVVLNVQGKQVSVYDTHLQNRDEPARIAQMNTILSIVAQDPRPQILGGDFNSQPDSAPLNLARSHFVDTWGTVGVGTGRTHPANHLQGRIDYLMNANKGIVPLASDVLPARLSDHMAVRAQYRIDGPKRQLCVQMLNGGTATGSATGN